MNEQTVLRVGPHYSVAEVDAATGMQELRATFTEDVDYSVNWLFIGMGGVHGGWEKIDDVLAEWDDRESDRRVNMLVVFPRLVAMRYGEIRVGKDDLLWLRGVVAKTLEAVCETQTGNVPDKEAKGGGK